MMIEENQLSVEFIRNIFQNAYMDVSDIQDNEFSVKGPTHGYQILVRFDDTRKLVSFCDVTSIYNLSMEQACILANEANCQYNRCCFAIYPSKDPNRLVISCQYDMSCEKGLIPFQLVSNFRSHERVAFASLQELFKSHITPPAH